MTDQNTRSISELQQLANEGDAQAQFDLALCYVDGSGVDRNVKLALEWIIKAAEQGLIHAQCALGLYYLLNGERGEIVNKILPFCIVPGLINPVFRLAWVTVELEFCDSNDDLAFTWNRKAAEQGCAEAQFWLAYCYAEGLGVNQNDKFAFEWFKKSAEQNIADSKYWLVQYYLEGKGVEQSDEFAFKWLIDVVEQTERYCSTNQFRQNFCESLSEESLSKAYLLLGDLCVQGKGTSQNNDLAFKCYEKVSKNHENGSQELRLARCYEYGIGVEKNMVSAGKHYRLAAEKGYSDAEVLYRFAMYYLQGVNVEKNYELGMECMINSARQGHEDASNWLTNAYLSLAIPSHLTDKKGGEQYYKFAVDWCLKELDGHNATEAYLLLGVLYYSGKGVEQSNERSLACFNQAQYISNRDYPDPDSNMDIDAFIELFLSTCCAQQVSHSYALHLYGEVFMEGIIAMPFRDLQNNKIFLTMLRIAILKKAGEYELAKEFTKEVFDKTYGMDKNFKEICLMGIEQEQMLVKQNKALHEKEKEMLSFFTHTMRNALATAPESLRQAIHLLGSEVYEKDTKHYQAINKIAALFSTLSLTDCLIDTFKQSISDPQEFKQSWQKDHTGEATPKWVIASALRQSLNRIIFMSGSSELRKLLNNPETVLIKATRKSFIEEVLPLNIDSQGVELFYSWTRNHIPAIKVSITDFDELNFGANQVRFSLLFAITSELVLNALKYWDGEDSIQISWRLGEQDKFVFLVKNHCKANASSNLAGTHKGLAFIKRLAELLGEQAQFECKIEDQLFTAELILNKSLFDGEI
ncbi:MAG: hypothetical protein WCG16_11025 [Methylococcales bacterium]